MDSYRLENAEERLSKFENRAAGSSQTETQREKRHQTSLGAWVTPGV